MPTEAETLRMESRRHTARWAAFFLFSLLLAGDGNLQGNHSPWDKGDASRYPPEKIQLPPYLLDTSERRKGMSNYLAEITFYDDQVRQILDLLEKHDFVENTIVMLSSEQGNSMPFAKWTLYDNGLQTAMIVRWPGKIAPGSKSDALIEYVDAVPTLLDAIEVDPVAELDGESFLPVLLGTAARHKDYVFGIMTTKGIINGSDSYGTEVSEIERIGSSSI